MSKILPILFFVERGDIALKFSYSQVKEFIENNSNCKLISDSYKNDATPLELECECGNLFNTTFNAFKFKNKRQCNECGRKSSRNKQRISYTVIKNYIEVESGLGTKLLTKEEDYKNTKTPIRIQCSCGNIFSRSFENYKKGTGLCEKCIQQIQAEKFKFTYEFVKEFIEKVSNSGCILISDKYKNNTEKLTIKCACGSEFKTTFASFMHGNKRQCNACGYRNDGIAKRKTHEEFIKNIFELVGNEYTVLSQYSGADNKILIRHNSKECDFYEYYVTPHKFLNGRRCPKCQQSNGEKIIRNWLDRNNINYSMQYKFKDCKNIKPLPFDFAIFDRQNNLICLIEYQGEQHFRPVEIFGGEESFKITKENDLKKKQYCKDNNITLIEIPYTDLKNITIILEKLIKKVNDYEFMRCS